MCMCNLTYLHKADYFNCTLHQQALHAHLEVENLCKLKASYRKQDLENVLWWRLHVRVVKHGKVLGDMTQNIHVNSWFKLSQSHKEISQNLPWLGLWKIRIKQLPRKRIGKQEIQHTQKPHKAAVILNDQDFFRTTSGNTLFLRITDRQDGIIYSM